jgi:phosphopantetheine adenylyltransferase
MLDRYSHSVRRYRYDKGPYYLVEDVDKRIAELEKYLNDAEERHEPILEMNEARGERIKELEAAVQEVTDIATSRAYCYAEEYLNSVRAVGERVLPSKEKS